MELMKEINEKVVALGEAVESFKSAEGTAKQELASKIKGMEDTIKGLEQRYHSAFEVPGHKDEKKSFSMFKAIDASLRKDWSKAGFEKEVSDKIAKSINADTGSAGGFFAPVNEMSEIIAMPKAGRPIISEVGIKMISGLGSGEITMNKVTGGNTAYWGGSEAEATESNMAIGQISLKPHYLRGWTTLSRELLKQTTVGVEALIREELGYAMSKKLEEAALYGTGTGSEPKGVIASVVNNVIALGDNGALPDWDDMDDLVAALEADDTYGGNLAFLTSPQIAKVLRQTKFAQYSGDTGGAYYIPKKSNAGISEQLGHSFYTSTLVPVNVEKGTAENCSYIVFGDWSQMIMASWGGMEIRVSEQAATPFKQNQVLIAAFGAFDFAVKNENAFAVIKDAKIA